MKNFSSSDGFFGQTAHRWSKWGERHQHLPLSIARVPCYSFYVGKWAGSKEQAWELAVGQEFTRALLLVLWPERYGVREWAGWEEPHGLGEILKKDLADVTTTAQKDELTLDLYTKIENDAAFRDELEQYAASARGKAEIGDDGEVENPPFKSNFSPIWNFPLVYKWACDSIFFVPVHQQLVESLFSLYDNRSQKFDQREVDIVRIGQYRSMGSRAIGREVTTGREIRKAGIAAIRSARAAKKEQYKATPNARNQRKRGYDTKSYLAKARESFAGTNYFD